MDAVSDKVAPKVDAAAAKVEDAAKTVAVKAEELAGKADELAGKAEAAASTAGDKLREAVGGGSSTGATAPVATTPAVPTPAVEPTPAVAPTPAAAPSAPAPSVLNPIATKVEEAAGKAKTAAEDLSAKAEKAVEKVQSATDRTKSDVTAALSGVSSSTYAYGGRAGDEVKEEPRRRNPMEMEEGSVSTQAPAKPPALKREKPKNIFARNPVATTAGVVGLLLLIGICVLVGVLWFRKPTYKYMPSSKIKLDKTGIVMEANLQFNNRNNYPLKLTNLAVDVADSTGQVVGKLTYPGTFIVPKKSSATMKAGLSIPLSLSSAPARVQQATRLAQQCLKSNVVPLQIKGSVLGAALGFKKKTPIGPTTQKTSCIADAAMADLGQQISSGVQQAADSVQQAATTVQNAVGRITGKPPSEE